MVKYSYRVGQKNKKSQMKNSRIGLKNGFYELCSALKLSKDAAEALANAIELKTINDDIDGGSITYVQDQEIISRLNIPKSAIVLAPKGNKHDCIARLIIVDNPEYVFWSLFEFFERSKESNLKSQISKNVNLGENVLIHDCGVQIGDDVSIGENTVICSGVSIGSGSVIGPGCVIGSNGFQVKNTIFGKKVITHKGGVIISENVEIGANCTVNQGLGSRPTIIASDTKIDCGVHIAHSCNIGSRNIIAAQVAFGGNVEIGDDIFIGLNATLKNRIKLPSKSFVGAGVFVANTYKNAVKITLRASLAFEI